MSMRPNILFINVDQLRFDCLGVNGNQIVKTPNIDTLCNRGISFTKAYTPLPSCCPARQSLMTGVMPEQHKGLWNYGSGGSLPIEGLSTDASIWVEQLRASGYKTAYVGKWHVNPHLDPTHYGFDSYDDVPNDPFNTPYKAPKYKVDNPWPEFPVGHEEALPVEDCHTHTLVRKCIQKIETLKQSEEPWHLRLDHFEPHLPCIPAGPFASMYPPNKIPPWENFNESFVGKPYIQKQQVHNWCLENWTWEEWSIYMSGYYGIISQLDDALGNLLNYLDENSLLEKTLIIFTTDHGDAAGSHRQMDKHYTMYEEVTHVPLFMRWDGVIKPGSTCNDFVSHFLDLPVTLLDLLNLEIPENYQGQTMLPMLKGELNPNPRKFAFSTYNGQQFGLYCQRMIRDEKYKYIWNPTDVDELYDLESDPFEMDNLAAQNPNSCLCQDYRNNVYKVFSELDDPLVTGLWNARFLKGESNERKNF